MKAILTSIIGGEKINVHSTTNHPASSYGLAVWVDDEGHAYCQVNCPVPNPFYTIEVTDPSDTEEDE